MARNSGSDWSRRGRRFLARGAVGLLALIAMTVGLFAHEPPRGVPPMMRRVVLARKEYDATCRLTLSLVDRDTKEPVPGIVQVRDAAGDILPLAELVSRGQGVEQAGPIHDWWALPHAIEVEVPAAALEIRALSGLETDLASQQVDLTGKSQAMLRVELDRFFRARDRGLAAGNTHLHLMKLSKQQADRYLREVPLADGLEVVFLSYLERAGADLEYTSNNYTRGDLDRLSHEWLRWGHGQEHRHNFGSHGEGYGHLLLLNIPEIIQPVSIGPGIMKRGADAPPLQVGIDAARNAGGKVIWAHNVFGFEDIPNWVTGRVHAQNIFDGSARGSFKDTYYRYLNVGLRVPFSTGTDWFLYDFSRVYVAAERRLTPTEWLERLAAGRSFITNGPLLEFAVEGQSAGGVIECDEPATLSIGGRAVGRHDFGRVELVQNGKVVGSAKSQPEAGHFVAELNQRVTVAAPAWFALRTPPPPVKGDVELQTPVGTNELGGSLFAHTSPVYVDFGGKRVFDRETAVELIAQMKSDWKEIEAHATFDDTAQHDQVARVYEEAVELLEIQIKQHSH